VVDDDNDDDEDEDDERALSGGPKASRPVVR